MPHRKRLPRVRSETLRPTRPDPLSARDLLASMLSDPTAGVCVHVSDPLIGHTWKLIDTGHEFRVLGITATGSKFEVQDGRSRRWLPADLVRAVYKAGGLEKISP